MILASNLCCTPAVEHGSSMDKLVLHVCCAPCAVYPVTILKDRYDVTLLFYGPNIHPEEEYKKRLESARKLDGDLVELEYTPSVWFEKIKGLEDEPEGGERCRVCYRMRLERTAVFAKENGYKYFGCTLTLSPHKPADVINPIGKEIAEKYGLNFLSEDFKKKNGFKRSCQLSGEAGLYRQRYCGCRYSAGG